MIPIHLSLAVLAAASFAGGGAAPAAASARQGVPAAAAESSPASDSGPRLSGMAVIVAPGETMAVKVAGSGPPVLVVPGLFGSAFAFRKVTPLLVAAGHTVLVVDPLGVGSSSRPADADYSLTAQADRLAAVLDALHLHDVLALCHTLGASMCYRLAYRHPGALAGIVSINGGPAEAMTGGGMRFALHFSGLIKLFGGLGAVRSKVRARMIENSGDSSWVTPPVVDAYMQSFGHDLDDAFATLKRLSSAHEPEPLAPHLDQIRIPVVLLLGTGTTTGVITPSQTALLERTLPDLAVDSVAGAGEDLNEERPRVVAGAVLQLARRLAAAAGGDPAGAHPGPSASTSDSHATPRAASSPRTKSQHPGAAPTCSGGETPGSS